MTRSNTLLVLNRLASHMLFVTLLIALLSACSFPGTGQATPTPQTGTTPPPIDLCTSRSSNPVTLTMYYGSEKQLWIKDVVADFNSRKLTACDGPITVTAIPIGSGDSMQQILDGKIQPDIWSPAGRVWLTILNGKWQQKFGSDITAKGTNAGQSIKIFTIAYGNQQDVDVTTLTQVASASGGQEYAGNPQNIQQVYLDISQFF